MAGKKPKIWVTRGFHSSEGKGWWMDFITTVNTDAAKNEIKKQYNSKNRMPDESWPIELVLSYKKRPETVVRDLRDLFCTGGFTVISKRFYELLQQFNLGQTAFRAIPAYGYARESKLPEEYYMMQFLEFRAFALPEKMENARPTTLGLFNWYPDKPAHKPILKVPDSHDLDLWMDEKLRNWVFVSDRLKEAIKSEQIKGARLGFRPCRLLDG